MQKQWKKDGSTEDENILQTSEKFCKAEGISIYYIMSQLKDAFADGTIRTLKKLLYRSMEEDGFKYIRKNINPLQLWAAGTFLLTLIPKKYQYFWTFSLLYCKRLQ